MKLLRSILLSALLVAPLAPAFAQRPQRSPQDLERLGREYLALAFDLSPWLAEERGAPQRLGLGSLAAKARAKRLESLDRLGRELRQLAGLKLTPKQLGEVSALRALVAGEHARYEARTPERWNPQMFVQRAFRLLLTKENSDRSPEEVRRDTLDVLRALPEYWQEAALLLLSPQEEWTREAQDELLALVSYIEDRKETLVDEENPEFAKKAEAIVSNALKSTRAFQLWLDQAVKGTGPANTRIDAEHWLVLVRTASGTRWNIDEIKWRVLSDLTQAERDYGDRWRTPSDPLDAGAAEDAIDADLLLEPTCLLAMDVARRAGLLPPVDPAGILDFRTHDLPQRLGIDALDLPGQNGVERVLLDPRLVRSGDEATHRAVAIRFGFPGVALLTSSARREKDVLPRFLWNRSVVEGWGLYALDWLPRIDWVENSFANDEALLAEAARMRMLEGARLLASLELHAGEFSIAEVAEGLRRRTGMSLERALFEARASMNDPLRGIGYLGWAELLQREKAVERTTGFARALGTNLAEGMHGTHLRVVDRP